MKIEIAKLGRMSQTGSSLISLYRDKHTPILDLLARECVQNSLDAGMGVSDAAENKQYVAVDFMTGDFCPSELNAILEGSTQSLNKRFPGLKARYLAVRDTYSAGLTGPLRMDEVQEYKYGNLLKLVYDICKPQEGQGAGGSWGIGKSIYFRIGIGLVLYYSRIWDEEKGTFAVRFAACMVEDEHTKDAVIPKDGNGCNTGIAWWGNSIGNDMTEPVTDENEINEYLSNFGIKPYGNRETGTTVIIPYVEEGKLLANNREEEQEQVEFEPSHVIPAWLHGIDDYITVAVQRWYFPRLNNSSYKYGRYLRLYVNGRMIGKSEMLPVFKIWQNLYNSAVEGRPISEGDNERDMDISVENVTVRKYLVDTCSGFVAFSLVGRDLLGMCPPDNFYSPYVYVDVDESVGDTNKPLLAFCRKPGMVVNYGEHGGWLNAVPYTEKDKYLLAIFALNSTNSLKDVGLDLEEYVRKSELDDHNSWDDHNLGDGNKPKIVARIKENTAKVLSKSFVVESDDEEEKVDSGWGKMVADLILPKEGFGTKSSRKNVIKQGLEFESHKTLSIAMAEDDTMFNGDKMVFTYYVKTRKKTQQFGLNMHIGAESKSINPIEWENDGLELPFEIESVQLRVDKLDGQEQKLIWEIDSKESNIVDELLVVKNNKTASQKVYGISVDLNGEHAFLMSVTFTLKVKSQRVKPLLKVE